MNTFQNGHLLIVDDDQELSVMLKEYLETEGYEVTTAFDGEQGLELFESGDFDLIVLDVMMPKLNGFDVLRRIRSRSLIPVLMLTARGDDIDSIVGLEIGADDYLAKPCNPRVLVARIGAILRRSIARNNSSEHISVQTLDVGDLMMSLANRTLQIAGQTIELTSTEFGVLHSLLEHSGEIVSKDAIYEKVLGRKFSVYDRSLDMHLSSLRKKIGGYANGQERIKTIRGIGYQYCPQS